MGWRAMLFVLAAVLSLARAELLPIRTYTTADGLASDHIYNIVADSRGFLWFATPEGLSRFDGYRFVSYGVEEGLPHQAITALIETRSGDHWIGTPRGLSRITASGAGPRFARFKLGGEAAANRIGALLERSSGALVAATAAGLFQWTGMSDVHRIDLSAPNPQRITDIAEDATGSLWIGTSTGGVYIYREGVPIAQLTVKDGLPGNWVEMLLPDPQGGVWAALRGGIARIARGGAGDWRVEQVYTEKTGLVGSDVKALAGAKDGTLWVGTSQGISILKWGVNERPAFRNLTRAHGLSDRQINTLAEDAAGNMWAGTPGAGVMRIDSLGFTTYREADGLPTDHVHSVLEDRAARVLTVATDGRSERERVVGIFDGGVFRTAALKTFSDNPGWGWNQILLQSRAGEWWAATGSGLCRFGVAKSADLNGLSPRACYSNDKVFRIFEDSGGGIWASAQSPRGDQLMRWDPRTNAVVTFPPRVPGEHPDDLVSAFAEDRKGNIWMGLHKGGLYRYDGRGFQPLTRDDGVPGGVIFSLFADRSGRLWIGSSGDGLGRIDHPESGRPQITIYNTARGMASNIVRCVTQDREGRIYAGTGKSVDRLDPETGHIRHFTVADGLPHGEFTSALCDRSGALWFATRQGLSRFIPAPDPPPVAPRILLTELRVAGVAYPLSQLGESRISRLELRPSQNQLQIEFVGLDYQPGDVLRYSYKLEGADSDWSPARGQHAVNYAALTDGKYRFLVKAVTSEGVESAAPAEIDFVVLPPVWKRFWFESLAAALVAALVFAAHRYRLAQMMHVERVRTAIATDMTDDIGAGLSQIAILTEVARAGGGSGDVLERVAGLARELVDSMGDIVWSIRPEPHGMDSLVRRMREFALDLLGSQGIEFEFRAPETVEDVPLTLQARRQLFLMFKESIHNAARHSRCTRVIAELRVSGKDVALTVEDNGAGMPSDQTPGWRGGTGISNLRQRAGSLGGSAQFTAPSSGGFAVVIRFPARRAPLERAAR